MSTFRVVTSKRYDGAMEVTVEGEDEILKGVDMLALVKEAVKPASDDVDAVEEKVEDHEGRIKTIEEWHDKWDKKLDAIDKRLDAILERLDRKPEWTIQLKPEDDKSTQLPYAAPDWVYRPSTTPVPVSVPNTSYGMPWETAPYEATRKRLWNYWHNPDGTPKLNCSVDSGGGLPPAPFRGVDTTGSKPTGVKMTFVDGQLASCREVDGNGETVDGK